MAFNCLNFLKVHPSFKVLVSDVNLHPYIPVMMTIAAVKRHEETWGPCVAKMSLGMSFGELALIEKKPRSATVVWGDGTIWRRPLTPFLVVAACVWKKPF